MLPISEISLHQVNGLAAQVDSFEHSFAEAIHQGDGERAAGLTLAARLEGKAPLDGPQLLWLLERFDDPVLVPCLAGACADPIETLAMGIGVHPDQSVVVSMLLVLGLLLQDKGVPKSVLRPARRFLHRTPFSPASPLAVALELLDDRALYAVAGSPSKEETKKLQPLVEGFRRCLAGDFRALLVDSQPYHAAAGAAPAWSKCKRLRQTDNVFSTRLGRDYRMLFRVEEKESQLRIEQMVHRSELERTIKGLKF